MKQITRAVMKGVLQKKEIKEEMFVIEIKRILSKVHWMCAKLSISNRNILYEYIHRCKKPIYIYLELNRHYIGYIWFDNRKEKNLFIILHILYCTQHFDNEYCAIWNMFINKIMCARYNSFAIRFSSFCFYIAISSLLPRIFIGFS